LDAANADLISASYKAKMLENKNVCNYVIILQKKLKFEFAKVRRS